jgi:[ribosomal protein S5]-alanine N-acetyltransferase
MPQANEPLQCSLPKMASLNHLPSNYQVSTPRLMIRTAKVEDAHNLQEMVWHEDNNEYMEPGSPMPLGEFQKRIEQMKNSSSGSKIAYLLICLKDTDEVIGFGRFDSKKHQTAFQNVGLAIEDKYRRMGYGREALCALFEMAFDVIKLEKVRAKSSSENRPFNELMRSLKLQDTSDSGAKSNNSYAILADPVYSISKAAWTEAADFMTEKGYWPLHTDDTPAVGDGGEASKSGRENTRGEASD